FFMLFFYSRFFFYFLSHFFLLFLDFLLDFFPCQFLHHCFFVFPLTFPFAHYWKLSYYFCFISYDFFFPFLLFFIFFYFTFYFNYYSFKINKILRTKKRLT